MTFYLREQVFSEMASLFSLLRITIIRVYVKNLSLIRRERCLEPAICSTVSPLCSLPLRIPKYV